MGRGREQLARMSYDSVERKVLQGVGLTLTGTSLAGVALLGVIAGFPVEATLATGSSGTVLGGWGLRRTIVAQRELDRRS